MTINPYDLRTATTDDWDAALAVLRTAFNEDDYEHTEAERGVFEPERMVLAETGGQIAGVSAAFTRDLVVPGGVVPAAHVTQVSVLPTHRRKGLLRRMITKLHADALTLGEPIAVLWASEGRIYQRFGYGLATRRLSFETPTGALRMRDPDPEDAGTLRAIALDSLDEVRKVYDTVYAERPGWSSRDDRWWAMALDDPKSRRSGTTAQRCVVHEGPGGVDGYLIWRVRPDWSPAGPAGTVNIREMVAATPEAYRSLWSFAFAVDLTRNVQIGHLAADEPLLYLLDEPRALALRASDGLWIRVLDVPAALAARRYAAPVDVVIEVTDADLPANAGRFRLVGGPDHA